MFRHGARTSYTFFDLDKFPIHEKGQLTYAGMREHNVLGYHYR